MLVIYVKPWQCGHNTQKYICGTAWRLNGTKWAIFQMLGHNPKGGFPHPLSKGTKGKGQSHIYCLWWCSYKWFPLPLFPAVSSSSYSHFFSKRHIPTLWPEGIWVLSVVKLSAFTAKIPNSFMALVGAKLEGQEACHPKGIPTPTSVPDLYSLPQQIKSNGFWWVLFTHSRDISNCTGAPLLLPHCLLRLVGVILSMRRSHWRKCQLNLRSLNTAVHLMSTWQGICSSEWGRHIL